MAKLKTERDIQNEAIRSVFGALGEVLVVENNANAGDVFRPLTYGGKTITAEDRATAIVAQCFYKMVNGNGNLEYIEFNLVKAILQKAAIQVFENASAEYAAEQRKAARDKELVARAKVAANDPEVKRTRKARVSKEPMAELPSQIDTSKYVDTVAVMGKPGAVQDPFTELDGKTEKSNCVTALSSLSGLDDDAPPL